MSEDIVKSELEIEEVSDAMASIDMIYVTEQEKIYNDIMKAYPLSMGKASSKKEREDLCLQKVSTLIYGEIEFTAFAIVIQKIIHIYGKADVGSSGPMGILQSKGGLFYDLGSGTGKAVIAAACLHSFDSCIGIEILEGLHSISMEAVFSYNSKGKNGKGLEAQCQVFSI